MNDTKKAAPGVEVQEREDVHAEEIILSDKVKAELAIRDEVIAFLSQKNITYNQAIRILKRAEDRLQRIALNNKV